MVVEKMLSRKFAFFFGLLIISLFIPFTWSQLFDPLLVAGQLSKQTFVSEMSNSFKLGRLGLEGFFPLRTFYEWYHTGPLPWAEEFPLYTFLVGKLAALFNTSVVITGRLVAFFFYFVFLVGTNELMKALDFTQKMRRIWFFYFSTAPVFFIYSIGVMLEIPMMSMIVWGAASYLREERLKTFLFFMLAALFKYYALFFMLGLFLYRRRFFFLLGFAALPSILYVLFFIFMKVPNPVTEYQQVGIDGHFSTTKLLFSLKFYSRLFTWNIIKNLGPLMGGLGLIVFVLRFIKVKKTNASFFSFQLVSYLIFVLIFAHGVYIHDYYSIQFALVFSLFIVHRCSSLLSSHVLLMVAAVLLNFKMSYSALKKQTYFYEITQEVRGIVGEGNFSLLVTGDGPLTTSLFHLETPGRIIVPGDWSILERKEKALERMNWVLAIFYGEKRELNLEGKFLKVLTRKTQTDEGKKHSLVYELYKKKDDGYGRTQ